MENLDLAVKEIEKILIKSPVTTELQHGKAAKKWLLVLEPNANEAMQIAALAHDIERSFIDEKKHNKEEYSKDYNQHKREHSERSAKVVKELLEKFDFNENFINKVYKIVLNHEFGGDRETDLVRDADSISFFEINFNNYLKKYGSKKSKEKIHFMYDRMSDKAKEVVKPLYDKAINQTNAHS